MNLSERFLDTVEKLHYESNSIIAWTTGCNGRIAIDKLAKAYEHTCDSYPVLRSKVCRNNGSHILKVDAESRPRVIVKRGDKAVLIKEAKRLARGTHPAVSYLLLVHFEDVAYVTLGMDHAIADGHAAIAYLSELWKRYTTLVNQKNVARSCKHELPYCPSEVLRKIAKSFDRSTLRENRTRNLVANRPESSFRAGGVRQSLIEVDLELTHRILGLSKRNRINVGALLVGIMAAVLRPRQAISGRIPMTSEFVVDLRRFAKPPIGNCDSTTPVSIRHITVDVGVYDDPLHVAGRFQEELNNRMTPNEDDAYLINATPQQAYRRIIELNEFRSKCFLHINNLGYVPDFSQPSGLDVNDFVSPMYFPDWHDKTRAAMDIPYNITSYSFRGKLKIVWLENGNLDPRAKQDYLSLFRKI